MSLENVARELIDEFRSRPTLRAGSLITTVFGDSIAPRGGVIWLGSLIKAMADFGVSERLVRTSVFRLVKDGWLEANQVGRRSYYRLTDEGSDRFRTATHRIYGEPGPDWDGSWCMLLLSGLNAVTRDLVRRECGWLGFGAVSSNVLANPAPDIPDTTATLQRLGVDEAVVILTGCECVNTTAMQKVVQESWNLDDIDTRYRQFVTMFEPVRSSMAEAGMVEPKTAFLLRTLLIQEYRKVLLRDPKLPVELLPEKWHGTEAYRLCRDLYCELYEPADRNLSETMETDDGLLPPATPDTLSRFGGLAADSHRRR